MSATDAREGGLPGRDDAGKPRADRQELAALDREALVRLVLELEQRLGPAKVRRELREREKELDLLHAASAARRDTDRPVDEVLTEIVRLIPPAWLDPDVTCARINVDGRDFVTPAYRSCRWTQVEPILVEGEQVGDIEVGLLEDRPEADEGPFLAEERELLGTLARDLGHFLERRWTGEAFEASESLFASFFEGSRLALAITSPEKGWIRVNTRLCQMLGYSEEELRATTWAELTHPDDLEVDVAQFKRLLAGDIDGYELDKRFVRSDGDVVATRLTVACSRTEEGAVDHVFATLEDVTEQLALEERLRDSEAKFRALFESAPVGAALLDADGHPVETNARLQEILGYSADELAHMSFTEFTHPEDVDADWQLFQDLVGGRRDRYSMVKRYLRADGELVWGSLGVSLVRDDDGGIRYVMGTVEDITERQRAEEALLAETRFSEAVLESLPGVCYLFDQELRFQRWNTNFERVTGYSAQEMTAITPLDLFGEEDQQRVAERIGEVFTSGQSSVEAPLRSKDGTGTPYLFTGHQVEIGGETFLVGMGVDVSDRVAAEEALRESEARYRAIFADVPVSIWEEDWSAVIAAVREARAEGVEDFEGYLEEHPELVQQALGDVVILDVNQATLEMFGADGKEQMLDSLETVFATEDTLPGFVGELVALARGDRVYRTEMGLRRVDGELIHVLLTMSFPEPGSESGQVLVSLMDISARKKAEQELLVFRRLVEAAGQGIGFAELDGTIRYVNPALERMIDPGEGVTIEGARFLAMYPPEQRRRLEEEVLPAVLDHGRWSGSLALRSSNGGELPTLEEFFLIANERGQPLYLGDVITDISDERCVQAELERSNEELERFAYVASHDLQEPLRMVSSFTQLLAERYADQLDADAREFIGFAVDGANRMQRLIRGLLAYSRVTTRGGDPEPVDAHEVLGEAVANLSSLISETGALVSNGDLPVVVADRMQLVSVFQNLVHNALKFRGDDPPRVFVTAAREPEGDLWRFEVRDNGIGIEAEHLERVFVIFQRLHPRHQYPGTGMGLSLAKRIVERHGGRMWLESTPGEGSCFHFTLPGAEESHT